MIKWLGARGICPFLDSGGSTGLRSSPERLAGRGRMARGPGPPSAADRSEIRPNILKEIFPGFYGWAFQWENKNGWSVRRCVERERVRAIIKHSDDGLRFCAQPARVLKTRQKHDSIANRLKDKAGNENISLFLVTKVGFTDRAIRALTCIRKIWSGPGNITDAFPCTRTFLFSSPLPRNDSTNCPCKRRLIDRHFRSYVRCFIISREKQFPSVLASVRLIYSGSFPCGFIIVQVTPEIPV